MWGSQSGYRFHVVRRHSVLGYAFEMAEGFRIKAKVLVALEKNEAGKP